MILKEISRLTEIRKPNRETVSEIQRSRGVTAIEFQREREEE